MKKSIFSRIEYSLILFALTGILLLSCNNSPQLKVLIVTGGHDFEREQFFNLFDEMSNIEYDEVVHPKANEMYSSDSIGEYDAVIFYDMVQEITEDQKQSLLNLLEDGKGMIFLHHSLVSYQEWDEFEKIIGGKYYLQPDTTDENHVDPSTYKHDVQVPVELVDNTHPILAGMENFVIHDEVYGGFNVLPNVNPLLKTSHPESTEIIAWTNKYLNSNIVYIQLGHDHHAYENPNYSRLIKQSIDWVIVSN